MANVDSSCLMELATGAILEAPHDSTLVVAEESECRGTFHSEATRGAPSSASPNSGAEGQALVHHAAGPSLSPAITAIVSSSLKLGWRQTLAWWLSLELSLLPCERLLSLSAGCVSVYVFRIAERLSSPLVVFSDAAPFSASPVVALASLDGLYLSSLENEFYSQVLEDLERFRLEENQKKVLLFPPLTSRLRYITHRITETFNSLSSFSVGEGWKRRTVVCHLNVRLPDQEDVTHSIGTTMHQTPNRHQKRYHGARGSDSTVAEHQPGTGPPNRGSQRSRGRRRFNKRPDQALYVPPRRSQKLDAGGQKNELGVGMEPATEAVDKEETCLRGKLEEDLDNKDYAQDNQGLLSSSSGVTKCEEDVQFPSANTGEEHSETESSRILGESTEITALADGMGMPEQGNQGENCIVAAAATGEVECIRDLPLDSGTLESSTAGDEEKETDEDGADQLLKEIATRLTEKDIGIEKPQFDYSTYCDVTENEDKFGHIIEIFDFAPALRTEDLMEAFTEFQAEGFRLQWVNDTHALGIFSSQTAAVQALSMTHPLLKFRPLSQGTKQSQFRARQRAEFFQPTKWRSPTDPSVAKRLVKRALGLQNQKEPTSE
ncbi:R3H and coiled-coil domain-containing protein 1 [Microcaecilia unicolor]|uniref:R3H and coiled-coil domain-containing protein 1 n=1 Tax=Microcaecilia unicolor TaxID=1415580 RepID=A0A6P7XSG2_9AMPH|nr:R3H and coiled-coil domain-containing protein 1 [Microcaecilia unicolor]